MTLLSIKFQCNKCGKTLRTSDDKAGLTANCPGCSASVTIPTDTGESFVSQQVTCPMCGETQDDQALDCSSCGESLSPRRSRKPKKNNSRKAGFGIRLGAHIIDVIIINVSSVVVGFGVGIVMAVSGIDARETGIQVVLNVLGFVIGMLYYAILESSEGQATVGKMAVGIKVTTTDGNRLSIGNALGRYFAKLISALFCLLGFIWVAFDEKSQGWHDKIAGTYVVYK